MKREYGYMLIQDGRGDCGIDLLFDRLSKSFEAARESFPHFEQCEYGYFYNNNWYSIKSDERG